LRTSCGLSSSDVWWPIDGRAKLPHRRVEPGRGRRRRRRPPTPRGRPGRPRTAAFRCLTAAQHICRDWHARDGPRAPSTAVLSQWAHLYTACLDARCLCRLGRMKGVGARPRASSAKCIDRRRRRTGPCPTSTSAPGGPRWRGRIPAAVCGGRGRGGARRVGGSRAHAKWFPSATKVTFPGTCALCPMCAAMKFLGGVKKFRWISTAGIHLRRRNHPRAHEHPNKTP
jgi:hypothetical protein